METIVLTVDAARLTDLCTADPNESASDECLTQAEFDPSALQHSSAPGFVLGDTNALWAATGAPRRSEEDRTASRRFPLPVESS